MTKITKEMTMSQILMKYPETIDIFLKHGLTCVGCPMASQESLEVGANAHGIDADALLKDLNDFLDKKED